MNKAEALAKANSLAQKYAIGPTHAHEAAYFSSDSDTQNFIELERGGACAWKAFIQEKIYYPYVWLVRRFKEGDPNVAYFSFTPEGKPYGFSEHIAESIPGAALTQEQARARAESFLTTEWNTDLSGYKLKDSRKEVRPNGRIDHTFIYEKEIKNLGDAHYLLTVIVTGDKISTINHFIDIPEAFTRSFQHIRSFNETIHTFATIATSLVYLALGCLLGLLFLLKRRWLLPRQALFAGVGLSFLKLLAQFNQFPFLWFSYDTALPIATFLIQNFLSMLISFIGWAAIYTVTFMAAEGLTRRAFGGHLQLWSAWKLPVASSYTMLGKTVASYLLVAFEMAFVVTFYAVGIRYYGWWSPSSHLTDPNVLSTYVPAFGALVSALAAGFWEECLFRAVPIATCALIGRKLGSRTMGILTGLIVQAFIFGAAHANYPALPSYVRIVELFIPSIGFGVLYLLFGLIPGILAHTLFDAILFALPLFVADAPGMAFQRLLVILGCSLPLLIVIVSYLKTKTWQEAPSPFYNGAWQPVPGEPADHQDKINFYQGAATPYTIVKLFSLCIMAFTGLFIWCYSSSFTSVIPPLSISKSHAVTVANLALKEKNVALDGSWWTLPSISLPQDNTEQATDRTSIYLADLWEKTVPRPSWNLFTYSTMGSSLCPLYRRSARTGGRVSFIY